MALAQEKEIRAEGGMRQQEMDELVSGGFTEFEVEDAEASARYGEFADAVGKEAEGRSRAPALHRALRDQPVAQASSLLRPSDSGKSS